MWAHLLPLGLIDGAGGQSPEPPVEIIGGHYADFWRKQWLKQWEKREDPPTLAEVLEFVEAEPEQAVAVVRQERPAMPLPPMPQIDFDVIARQIQAIVSARQAQLAEEDDEDVLLLMM